MRSGKHRFRGHHRRGRRDEARCQGRECLQRPHRQRPIGNQAPVASAPAAPWCGQWRTPAVAWWATAAPGTGVCVPMRRLGRLKTGQSCRTAPLRPAQLACAWATRAPAQGACTFSCPASATTGAARHGTRPLCVDQPGSGSGAGDLGCPALRFSLHPLAEEHCYILQSLGRPPTLPADARSLTLQPGACGLRLDLRRGRGPLPIAQAEAPCAHHPAGHGAVEPPCLTLPPAFHKESSVVQPPPPTLPECIGCSRPGGRLWRRV